MKKINIIGHKNPDVDCIVSGYLLQEYLKYKKIDAKFIIPDKYIDKDTIEILKEFDLDYNQFEKEVTSDDVVLVDNHETNLAKNVLGIIDHHPPFSKSGYYINIKASATAKIIYDIIVENGDELFLNEYFYKLIFLAIVIDTDNFRNPKAIATDKDFIKKYSEMHSINMDKIYELADKTTDLEDVLIAIHHGEKEYLINNKKVVASYISVKGLNISTELDLIKGIKENIKSDCYLWVFMIVDIEKNSTILYEVYKNEVKKTHFDKVLSRGTDVIPMITNKLNKL